MHLEVTESSPSARIAQSACAVSVWMSVTSISCKQASAIVWTHSTVIISCNSSKTQAALLFSMDVNSISSVSVTNLPTSASTMLTIVGNGGLGTYGYSGHLILGNSRCHNSFWASDSSILCRDTPRGVGNSLQIAASIATMSGSSSRIAS